jgi:hypothetical protein
LEAVVVAAGTETRVDLGEAHGREPEVLALQAHHDKATTAALLTVLLHTVMRQAEGRAGKAVGTMEQTPLGVADEGFIAISLALAPTTPVEVEVVRIPTSRALETAEKVAEVDITKQVKTAWRTPAGVAAEA